MGNNKTQISDAEKSRRFLALFLPVQKKIYTYISYNAPNRNDSDDIFQEVAATLLSKFSEYNEGTNFLGWAITVAKYKILSFRRNNQRMRILFDEVDLDSFQHEALQNLDEVDENAVYLKKCLKKLPEKQSVLLRYRYAEDMTFRQIAKQLNISMQSVYKAISRIHNALMKCVKLHSKVGGIYEQ